MHEFKPLPGARRTLFPGHPEMAALATAQAKPGKTVRPPFLGVQAKWLVIDGRRAFVGSDNPDLRSENLKTEAGLLVEDEAFAAELGAEIGRDLLPENSWVIGRRVLPLRLEAVNTFIDDTPSLGPLDVWPVQNTSSFELKPAAPAVAPTHADFHRHDRDVGPLPGTDGLPSTKEILTPLDKAVGAPFTPFLGEKKRPQEFWAGGVAGSSGVRREAVRRERGGAENAGVAPERTPDRSASARRNRGPRPVQPAKASDETNQRTWPRARTWSSNARNSATLAGWAAWRW